MLDLNNVDIEPRRLQGPLAVSDFIYAQLKADNLIRHIVDTQEQYMRMAMEKEFGPDWELDEAYKQCRIIEQANGSSFSLMRMTGPDAPKELLNLIFSNNP